jgi:hypothetical protein
MLNLEIDNESLMFMKYIQTCSNEQTLFAIIIILVLIGLCLSVTMTFTIMNLWYVIDEIFFIREELEL